MNKTFRYVAHGRAVDMARLGWLPVADLGPVHGEWSILMEWLCNCPAKVAI